MNDIDAKLLSMLKSACPMQLWGNRSGTFILDTGAREVPYRREEVIAILNRERAALEVKANLIQHGLDEVKGMEGAKGEEGTGEVG